MPKKIAMVFPYAPSYREPIYEKMDQSFTIDWYFCHNSGHGLKQMDYSKLKSVNMFLSERCIGVHSFWYNGICQLALSQYDYIIIAGQTHCFAEWYIALRYGHRKKGPKIFFWTHGWYGKESKLQKLLKRVYYHFADGLLVYGERAKKLMLQEGFPDDKINPIHNSLNYDAQVNIRKNISKSQLFENHFGNSNPVLAFIGRLTKVKQLDLLVSAVGELSHKGHKYNIVFVGDGEERNNIELKVKEYGITEQVWFYGACFDEERTAELLYNSDLCVAPGNIGLTAMHSLIFGTPCLTHDTFEWQMPESEAIIDGKTGTFFKYQDAESLAQSIQRWFSKNGNKREIVREACIAEIDSNWNPYYQIEVLKKQFKE